MPITSVECSELTAAARWVDAKTAADAVDVAVVTMWRWVRDGAVLARRLPGRRGRVRVALDASGFPVEPVRRPRRAARV